MTVKRERSIFQNAQECLLMCVSTLRERRDEKSLFCFRCCESVFTFIEVYEYTTEVKLKGRVIKYEHWTMQFFPPFSFVALDNCHADMSAWKFTRNTGTFLHFFLRIFVSIRIISYPHASTISSVQ